MKTDVDDQDNMEEFEMSLPTNNVDYKSFKEVLSKHEHASRYLADLQNIYDADDYPTSDIEDGDSIEDFILTQGDNFVIVIGTFEEE